MRAIGFDFIDALQALLRFPSRHRDGDGVIQRDDRRMRKANTAPRKNALIMAPVGAFIRIDTARAGPRWPPAIDTARYFADVVPYRRAQALRGSGRGPTASDSALPAKSIRRLDRSARIAT